MQRALKSIIRLPGRPPAARPSPKRGSARPTGQGPREEFPRYLTQEELGRFHRAVVAQDVPSDIALFGLMYRYGLRAVEVTCLLREDLELDLKRRRIRVRRAKHGKPKEYPLASDLVPALKRFMRVRLDPGTYLFTGRESNNLHGLRVLQVQRLFKHYAHPADLAPEVSSHSLRHSIAVHSLEEGFGLEYVSDLLGHTSICSTAIYAQVTTPAREAMIKRLDRSRHVVSWR